MEIGYTATRIGNICIAIENRSVIWLQYTKTKKRTAAQEKTSPQMRRALKEVQNFICGKQTTFGYTITFHKGTALQQKVWHALLRIPYGQTRTYGDIAKQIGNPRAVRAVATAIGKNPLPIIVPCHRVVRSDGTIGQYSGGIQRKKYLLELESMVKSGTRQPKIKNKNEF